MVILCPLAPWVLVWFRCWYFNFSLVVKYSNAEKNIDGSQIFGFRPKIQELQPS